MVYTRKLWAASRLFWGWYRLEAVRAFLFTSRQPTVNWTYVLRTTKFIYISFHIVLDFLSALSCLKIRDIEMSKQPAASAPTHAAPSISLLLTNLHLLDLDRRNDWPSISNQTFTNKNTLQNEKTRIQCVEWAFYRLFEIWDPVEAKDVRPRPYMLEFCFLLTFRCQKLGPFFPALVPLQSLNLRAALFRSLNELKKNGILGKDVMVRKTFFDDCRGERIQELLVSFSTLVLRKVLADGHGGTVCIAARLATAKTVTAKEQRSFLPLAVAHRASLTALLRKKKDLTERYKDFGRTLHAKEQELDGRLEAVASTQDLLDQNPIPDRTVARVSKLFENNWQGDRKLVEVIARGEEHALKDPLLDKSFSETWLQVSDGTFNGATSTSWQGLLQDLEKRVANQEARLAGWRNFKEAMKWDSKVKSAANNTSSTLIQPRHKESSDQKQRDPVFSPRKSPRKSDWNAGNGTNATSPTRSKQLRNENTLDDLKEREFVFSPRKSPRKSMWPVEDLEAQELPAPLPPTLVQNKAKTIATRNRGLRDITDNPVERELSKKQRGTTAELTSHVPSVNDTDESSFSEISDVQLHINEPDHTVRVARSNPEQYSDPDKAPSTPNNGKAAPIKEQNETSDISGPSVSLETLPTKQPNLAVSDDDDSWISSLPVESRQNDSLEPQSPNEDDKLAEQIISMTINAAPTPAKPKISLSERTRQSMAFASPVGLQSLLPEGGPSPMTLPPISYKTSNPEMNPGGPKTLLERTRQSISLVPSKKPKGSRKSMVDRRTSKIYPTNQFETPKRQLERVTEKTPPEALFSPGAGYDSVFKSRPKIAHSPKPSPRSGDDSQTDDAGDERDGNSSFRGRQRETSPLARMTAKV